MKVSVLIPAAGIGSRMRNPSTKKTYLKLGDRPILSHSIGIFDRISVVSEIFVITAENDFDFCRSVAIEPYNFRKPIELVVGGETRQTSVFNGLKKLSENVELVLIHDAVRPFATKKMVMEAISEADRFGAVTVSVPVKDSIKIVNNQKIVVETLDRSQLHAVQTPQVFRKDLIIYAHKLAKANQVFATDDAQLVEQIGHKVKAIEGSYRNLKITTPEDFTIAEALLQRSSLDFSDGNSLKL